jgi:hypothetical protein
MMLSLEGVYGRDMGRGNSREGGGGACRGEYVRLMCMRSAASLTTTGVLSSMLRRTAPSAPPPSTPWADTRPRGPFDSLTP